MATVTVTINGADYSANASDAQLTALDAVFSERNAEREEDDRDANRTAYLERIISTVCPQGTASDVVQSTLVSTLAAYAGESAPLSPEAETVRRVAGIKAEAQRRIIALTGTTDLIACMIKQSNANMRANELNDIRISGGTLTAEQEAETQALRNLATAIKAIRAVSDVLEQDPPSDWTSDTYWS